MRDLFDCFPLESCAIDRVDFTAAAIAVVHGHVVVRGERKVSASRWVFEDDDGNPMVRGAEAGDGPGSSMPLKAS